MNPSSTQSTSMFNHLQNNVSNISSSTAPTSTTTTTTAAANTSSIYTTSYLANSESHSPNSDISTSNINSTSTLLQSTTANIVTNTDDMNDNHNIQFKNYTVSNPPGFQQSVLQYQNILNPQNVSINPTYPTPNHTPIPSTQNSQTQTERSPLSTDLNDPESPRSKSPKDIVQESKPNITQNPSTTTPGTTTSRSNSVTSTVVKAINEMFPPNAPRDANGYPILSRDFVVRRISEGETGRLKEDIKCEACGKGYKHITSLAKHLWEHTAEWQSTKKLLISKHQQAQLLEAASILCSFSEKESSPESNDVGDASVVQNQTGVAHAVDPKDSKIYPLKQTVRRKSEATKTGKFGGKRRSTSFGLQSASNMIRRDSGSAVPPIDLRRPSMHSMRPSISFSASRRGSLLGSLIKEETDNQNSLVIYDSEDEDD